MNHINHKIISILLIITGLSITFGQEYASDRILVKLAPVVGRIGFDATADRLSYAVDREIVPRLNIVTVKIDTQTVSPAQALADIQANPWVEAAQYDHRLTRRSSYPSDPLFGNQWALENSGQTGGLEDADIDAPEAWDIATGGINLNSDTIVVAVIDDGCELIHPDLKANLWTNWTEFYGDSLVDDDNNGYVDDIHGWNAFDSTGIIPNDDHGTHVCGIIGADGNNTNQVSGVNWNVKVMPVAGASSYTSTAMQAYNYILEQRLLYNASGGTAGAYIVATNSSFGINYADCNSGSYPLWNDMYDALGVAGILNAVATMNITADVDTQGDVPSGCDSDYLVTVTNTTHRDELQSTAAYGRESIDLGAPGTNILSIVDDAATGTKTGTSMATPHVAGTIGLLHTVFTPDFANIYRNYPATGALKIKDMILSTVDTIPALNDITVSSGRLNLFKALLQAKHYLSVDTLDPGSITNLAVDTSYWYAIHLSWEDPDTLINGDPIDSFMIDIRRDGDYLATVNNGMQEYTDTNLPGGREYLYTVTVRLAENDSTSIPIYAQAVVPGPDGLLGDIDGDGYLSDYDINRMLGIVLGEIESTVKDSSSGDMDFNGSLDVMDILRMIELKSLK